MARPRWFVERSVIGFSGGGLDVSTLLRVLGQTRATGTLRVSHAGWFGCVAFESGVAVAASVGPAVGGAALEFIATALDGADFNFSPEPSDLEPNLQNAQLLWADLVATDWRVAHPARPVPPANGVPKRSQQWLQGEPQTLILSRFSLSLLMAVDGQKTIAELAAQHGLVASTRAFVQLRELGIIAVEDPDVRVVEPVSSGTLPVVDDADNTGAAIAKSGTLPLVWAAAITTWAIAAVVLVADNASWPIRTPIVLGFLLVCPGLAFVRLLQLEGLIAPWTLGVAVSLALDTLVAMAMVYTGFWSPVLGIWVLAGLSIVGSALQLAEHRFFHAAAPHWRRYQPSTPSSRPATYADSAHI